MSYAATIVVPVLNGEEFLEKLLNGIYAQKTTKKYEVLIIDSGSTDKTLEILKKFPKVRLHEIPNKEFGHGRTRNLGAQLAKGEFILYLTQDAIPTHEKWMDAMIEPFDISSKVGCVFGKQIPRSDCAATIKREVSMVFRSFGVDDSVVLHRKNEISQKFNLINTFMSNANSAVRRELLLKIPFRDVNYAEDQGLGIDMLEAGYYKAYAPLGSVEHSHNYGAREYFNRKFDEYVGLRKTTGYKASAGIKELLIGSSRATLADYIFIVRDKQYSFGQKLNNFLKSPFYNIGLRMAIRMAANRNLSEDKHSKFSLEAKAKAKAKK